MHRVNDVTTSCRQAVEVKQVIAASADDAVSVVFTQSIREKLAEVNRALLDAPSAPLSTRPLLGEAQTFQDARWPTALVPSGVPVKSPGATSRVLGVGEPDNVIAAGVLPSDTALELALVNWIGKEADVTVVCFNNRAQILVAGEKVKHVKLRPGMVDRFPLDLTLESGLNDVQCYSLRAAMANGEPAHAWPPIFAAFVQGS